MAELEQHHERVVAERHELDVKRYALRVFIGGDIYKTLDAVEQSRLNRQLEAMTLYSNILGERIAAFPRTRTGEREDRRQPWVEGMPPIKVWRVNDYEWWAGATLEEIRAEYERQTGIHPDNLDEGGFENPREVDDAGMQRLQFRRDDEDTFKDDPNLPWSFAQELAETIKAGTKFPCPFAGTEF